MRPPVRIHPLALVVALTFGSRAMAAEAVSKDSQVLITADRVDADQKSSIVTATGHVEISQGDRLLLADKVVYNQKTDVVSASGHVTMLEPTGEVLFADQVDLSDQMKVGVVHQLRILMTDNSRFAAAGGRRVAGVGTEMRKAVYSPCDLCKKDPKRPPLWQIQADKVVHDEQTHEVEYYDAFLEMWGIPVAYFPYFSHPDPTVKRRSGFLAPIIGNKSDLGFVFGAPYYFDIAPDKDLTITPIAMQSQGPLLDLQYRQRFSNGILDLSGSGTNADRTNDRGVVLHDQIRGHLRGYGVFDLDDTWRTGFNVARTTDDTYLARYTFLNFRNENVLRSRAYVEGFRDRNYASVEAYAFQGLRAIDDNTRMPYVLPTANYNLVGEPNRYGGFWTADTNLTSLVRQTGADSRRLSVIGGWHMPFKTESGHVFDFGATTEVDGYDVNNVPDPSNPTGSGLSGVTGRVFPQLSLQWSYPLVREHGAVRDLIEPKAAFIAAPNGGNPDKIPNEDSQSLEFDDTNLFSTNRFSGIDRVDGGQRFDYGVKIGAYGARGASTSFFIGQSYRFHKDSTFPVGSGLEDKLSDIVGNVSLVPEAHYNILYRFRLDKDSLAPRHHEVELSAGTARLGMNLAYIFVDESSGTGQLGSGDRQEVTLNTHAKLAKYWSASVRTRQDLEGAGALSYGLEAVYEDECFRFTTDFVSNRTRDREIQPSDTILFRFFFKHIGEVKG